MKRRKDLVRSQFKAKVDALEKQFASVNTQEKNAIRSGLESLRKADLDFTARIEASIASGLRKAAARIERKAG